MIGLRAVRRAGRAAVLPRRRDSRDRATTSSRGRVRWAAVLLLVGLAPAPAVADTVFTPFLGTSFADDRTKRVATTGASLASLGGLFGFEVDFSRTSGPLAVHGFGGEGLVTQLSGNMVAGLSFRAVRPYVLGGAGWMRMDVGATQADPGERREGLVVVAGGGLLGFLTDHVGARFDMRYLRQASVATTFRTLDLAPTGFWRATVGLALRF